MEHHFRNCSHLCRNRLLSNILLYRLVT